MDNLAKQIYPQSTQLSAGTKHLGYFKLNGLGQITLTDEAFEPLAGAGAELPRASDVLVFAG